MSQLAQLEPVIETLVDRSEQALGAVQHGVEVIGSRIGLVEEQRRRRSGWLWFFGFLAIGAVVFVAAKRLRSDDDEAAA